MDNAPRLVDLTITRLDESGIPDVIDLCLSGNPSEFRTLKKHLQTYAEPIGSWARNDSTRKALDRAYNANKEEGFLDYIAKIWPLSNDCEDEDDSKSPFWHRFSQDAAEYKVKYPGSNLSIYCDYILSKAAIKLNDVETLIWCAVACIEGAAIIEGFSPLRTKDVFVGNMVPVENWVPEVNDDGLLSTSRYRVMNYMLHNYMSDKNETKTQHVRGGVRWRKPNDTRELRKLCRTTAKLALYNVPYQTSLDLPLDVQFHFLEVFEWLQLSLFDDGVSAHEIEAEFSKFHQIRNTFYNELYYFYKKRESRRMYNHYV